MPLLLARIDDRLIHGQVAYGWSRVLHPTLLAVISDSLSADPDRAELCLFGVPDNARGRILSIAEALSPAFREEVERERTILIFPGTSEPLRLLMGGFPLSEVNVGGLHHAEGRREFLPYVFLAPKDVEELQAIQQRGARVVAQDLPSNPAHPIESFLGGPR